MWIDVMKLTPTDCIKGQVWLIIYRAISRYQLAVTQWNWLNLRISHILAGLAQWLLPPQCSRSRNYLHCCQFGSPCARIYIQRPGHRIFFCPSSKYEGSTSNYDIWYDTIWYDVWYMIRYDMIWYDMIWYDMIWYDMIWYDIFNCNWVDTRWQ